MMVIVKAMMGEVAVECKRTTWIMLLKIGDARLDSMETGSTLSSALIKVVRNKCNVINLPYSDRCVLTNREPIVQLAKEVVWIYGIVYVSSAGNNGPCLSTVGAQWYKQDADQGVSMCVVGYGKGAT